MSKITDAIRKIEKNRIAMSYALQELERLLAFVGFSGDDLPKATISNDSEVFLEYHGDEMSSEDIEYYMREVGYITPYDFR